MSRGELTPEREINVSATNTSLTYVPMTEWRLATGIDVFRAVDKLRNNTTLKIQGAYRTAAVRPDKPDAWQTFGAETSTTGARCEGTIAITTTSKFYVQWGLGYAVTAGQSFGKADLMQQVSFNQCGRLVGTRTYDINIGIDGQSFDAPVTEWMLAAHVSKFKMAVVMTNVDKLDLEPIYQVCNASTEDPANESAWYPTGSVITTGGASVYETCTTDFDITADVANRTWVRFGLRATTNALNTRAVGRVTVATATRT